MAELEAAFYGSISMNRLVPFALLALASVTSAALADPPPAGKSCFFINQFEQWKAPDNKTIYIRVNTNRFYRLDLSAACQPLTYPGAFLITKTRGPSTVCSAIDWDLSVAQNGQPGFRSPCIVKTMTPLTADEVAAIPKKFKP
jgi:hypothetical protein